MRHCRVFCKGLPIQRKEKRTHIKRFQMYFNVGLKKKKRSQRVFVQEGRTCVFKFIIDKWAEGIEAKISLSERLKLNTVICG